jgi:hypothetical protein
MRVPSVLSLAGVAVASSLSAPAASASPHVSGGCSALRAPLGSALFSRGSSVYKYEAANFWSNTELMTPGCVFRPQSSAQLAEGIAALASANAEFAVRGGGHMGIKVCFGKISLI